MNFTNLSYLQQYFLFESLLKKYFGSIADPMKNATNPINRVMTKLVDGLLIDNNRNIANRNRTTNG